MRATTNPGGPGHAWVKKMFIDPSKPGKSFWATDIETNQTLVYPIGHSKEGQPLFKPRLTRLHAVAWQARHDAQQRLYEAVTDYVRHGYNQALRDKKRHVGFLMILMHLK